MSSLFISLPLLLLLFGVALYDWKYRLIKNKVILPAMGVAFLLRLLFRDVPLSDSVLGFFFAGGVFWVGAWKGTVGGGDVKLMALVGFVFGIWHVIPILILLCILLLGTWFVKGNNHVAFAPYVFVAVCITYFIPK
jgi:Flp pilus assembly protein protease CpaA